MSNISTLKLTDNSLLIRNSDLIAADMDGETVMMSINKGIYYGINGVGSRIWTLLENQISMTDIDKIICAEYAVDAPRFQADLKVFIEEMLENHLISVVK
jgi:hypothetical protein